MEKVLKRVTEISDVKSLSRTGMLQVTGMQTATGEENGKTYIKAYDVKLGLRNMGVK
jgi:hypothetical protein